MSASPTHPTPDARAFRNVMGRFATGITVLTMQHGGQRRGMTANSVTSVSLEPMLLLCCIARTAGMHGWFESGTSFAVNILAADQQAVSRHFARSAQAADPMGGFSHTDGPTGAPLLDGVLAWADCDIEARLDGGDHTIVVGRVRAAAMPRPDAEPLLYFGGAYRELSPPRQPAEVIEALDIARSWESW
jgi:flavin reductase (DIM6/NTAB) family NADH-FMN oxidoreductase RutF